MAYKLLIVESPTKAKKIKDYLGPGFVVESSTGHVRDLTNKPDSKDPQRRLGIDLDRNFEPIYETIASKKTLLADLKKKAAAAEQVIMATDEDREGEAIAWHLCQILGLPVDQTERIVYHEITSDAIQQAMKSARPIDQNLVDAQQARRILDRLVGYELSPVLWRKVSAGLSAGRVQSVAVRLIVEKEVTIRAFNSTSFFKPTAIFRLPGTDQKDDLPAELDSQFDKLDDVRSFLLAAKDEAFEVVDCQSRPGQRRPPPPLKTSSLQQAAASRFGYSPKKTMQLAQRLYENGHITYMRTDSLNLGQQFLQATAAYLKNSPDYGPSYAETKTYQAGGKAQEAHEAIRPSDVNTIEASDDPTEQRLYKLIRDRTLASQMTAAKMTATTVSVGIKSRPEKFVIKGEVVDFPGFLKATGQTPQDVILPPLASGQQLLAVEITATEKLTKPPARYAEASLIGQLEDLDIGRPSTYAPTITTIIDRGYITKDELEPTLRPTIGLLLQNGQIIDYPSHETIGGAKNKLRPTPLGELVTTFLAANFEEIMDYKFTSRIEDQFDKIASGELAWRDQVGEFYQRFHPLIESANQLSRSEIKPQRELGIDPSDSQTIYARWGRFGPMLQKGTTEGEAKPLFAPLPKGTDLQTVDLAAAIKMFQLPRKLGQTDDGSEILAKVGPYGPYLEVGKQRVPLKDHDPFDIDLDTARQLLAEAKTTANRVIKEFSGGIKIVDGRFGPYVTNGNKNGRIPPKTDPESLTKQAAQEILDKAKSRRSNTKRRK